MKILKVAGIVTLVLFGFVAAGFALTVVTGGTPAFLCNTLLSPIGGVCTSATYTGAPEAKGTFSAGPLGLGSGVLLSSGKVSGAVPAVPFVFPSTAFGTAGDPALTAIAGQPTFDAAILTFSYTSPSTFVIPYVFASIEYPNFCPPSLFNDTVGFFQPVGTPVNSFTVEKLCANPQDPKTAGGGSNGTNYNATSEKFATPTFATSGTIKIAIADGNDAILDSTVFLGPAIATAEGSSLLLLGTGLVGLYAFRRRREAIA